ncbi:MAG: DMT family transporter [Rhizobiaceae bacterium]
MLTALGGLLLTLDIPLIRLGEGETWSVLMVRSFATFVSGLGLWGILKLAGRNPPSLMPGRAGLAVILLYAASSVTFMVAVFLTPAANLVFILAFNSAFAAILSWIFLKERPHSYTLAAITVMIGGVLLIVSDGISRGHWAGDLAALLSAIFIATAITVSRASGRDMGLTALSGAIIPALVGAAMVWQNGYQIENPGWILFNGLLVIPAAFYFLATGPRWISGPEVAMFYLLETVLAPIWIWMIFAETPTSRTLAGGAVLIVTLAIHSAWQLAAARKA